MRPVVTWGSGPAGPIPRSVRALVGASLLGSAWLAGCGTPAHAGVDEPVRLQGGTFREGPLPGAPPAADDASRSLRITALESVGSIVFPGQTGMSLSGRATDDTYAIGLRFPEVGTGYWLVPVGGEDPATPGELVWSAELDYGTDLSYGLLPLRVVALGSSGEGGRQRELTICSVPVVPDNLHACSDDIEPPAHVVSISWDDDVDVDLVVVTPEGKRVDAKQPTTAARPEGAREIPDEIVESPSTGFVDRDSVGLCQRDGFRRESIVWQGEPLAGTYLFYADLHDACGLASTAFRLTRFRRPAPREDGSWPPLEAIEEIEGDFVAAQADGGRSLGTYLTAVTFGE